MNPQKRFLGKALGCLITVVLIFGLSCRKDYHNPIESISNQSIKEEVIYNWLEKNPLSQALSPDWHHARQTSYQGKNIVRVPILNIDKLKTTDPSNTNAKNFNPNHPPELFFVQNTDGQVAGYLLNFIPKDAGVNAAGNNSWTGELVEWNMKGDTLHTMEVVNNKIMKAKLIAPKTSLNNSSLNAVVKSNKLAVAEAGGNNGNGGFWSFLGRILGAIGEFLGLPTRNTYADGVRIDWGEIARDISSWFVGAESYSEGGGGGGGGGGGSYLSAGGPIYASYLGTDMSYSGSSTNLAPLVYNEYEIYKGGPSTPPTPPNEDGIYVMEYLVLTPAAQEYILTYPAIPMTKMIRDYLNVYGWTTKNLAFASWAVEYITVNPTFDPGIFFSTNEFSGLSSIPSNVADDPEIQNGIDLITLPDLPTTEVGPLLARTAARNNTEDMTYGTGANFDGIYPSVATASTEGLFLNMKALLIFFTTNDHQMQSAALDFIEKFRSNTGGEYSHPTLTNKVKGSSELRNFVKRFGDLLNTQLRSNGGNINNISTITLGFRPSFNNKWSKGNGLTILINDTEKTDVNLESFNISNGHWTANIYVTIVDHFGLDKHDAIKYQAVDIGFAAWWALQHDRGYKPFETKIKIRAQIQGDL